MSPYVYVGLTGTMLHTLDEGVIYSHIARTFCDAMGFSCRALLSKSRRQPLMFCRQMIVSVLRDYHKFTYTSIASFMRRDHTTILNRYAKHALDYETNGVYSRQYDNILKQIL